MHGVHVYISFCAMVFYMFMWWIILVLCWAMVITSLPRMGPLKARGPRPLLIGLKTASSTMSCCAFFNLFWTKSTLFRTLLDLFYLLQRDRGAPLVCRDDRNVWKLSGIVSWSVTSSRSDCASIVVSTEVRMFRDWITRILTNN